MPTTSNFGWTTPADTDLVKDGAAAIRTLGNGIDTSLVDLKGGTTGQILSKASNTDLDYTWIANDQGDITEVQAGTGISVASGTGPIPIVTNTVATEFDAKGDLVVGTGADTFDRLAAGANGETLVANDSAAVGLSYRADFAAGKNKIINGDFSINQRGFTSTTTNADFGFDRWQFPTSGATGTYSAETFTLGAAPVAGYEAKNFARLTITTGNDLCRLQQLIESVRTFAGQTVTLSFWAKGTNPTTAGNLAVQLQQNFGTGGSPSSSVSLTQQTFVLTANWTRYSFTFSVPSISGKTLGTSGTDHLGVWIGQGTSVSTDAWTLDLWGVQLEAGSVATAFNTTTGTLAGELQAAQRYYFRYTPTGTTNRYGSGLANSTTDATIGVQFPVVMRTAPSALEQSGTAADYSVLIAGGAVACSAVPALNNASANFSTVAFTVASGLTAGQAVMGRAVNTSAFLGWSAEL